MSFLYLIAVLLPLFGGLGLLVAPKMTDGARNRYVFVLCLLVSLITAGLLFLRPAALPLFHFGAGLELELGLDGAGCIFAGVVALLWPITNLYTFEYMSHETDRTRFFAFFTATYGVVLGIAFSRTLLTLYLFYELLTLCTLPLVMHEMDGEARYAGKKYLLYSMTGAAMAFISMVILMDKGSLSFTMGGTLSGVSADAVSVLYTGFLLGFFGFGVKAAVFPLHGWLPTAGVAPTPVTALLHAVAVVNSGIFAIWRLIYFCYGAPFLQGSWAQNAALVATIITILFGSAMAWRVPHLKRRLAYSTVSNLSYILFAACLMSSGGFTASITHMVMHSLMKITLFFCAGSLLCQTHHKGYIYQYEGLGKRMPITCGAFVLSGLALMGVPPLPGFFSKWAIAQRAALTDNPIAWAGAAALMISAFLTGLYLVQVMIVFFKPTDTSVIACPDTKEAGICIKVSLIVLCVLILAAGLFSAPLARLFSLAAGNLI